MRCIIAVSNTGAPREILGNCAIYFDPYNIDSISSGIQKLVKSKLSQKKYNKKIVNILGIIVV